MKIRLIKNWNTGVKTLKTGTEFEVTNGKGLELISKGYAIQMGDKVKAKKEVVKSPVKKVKDKPKK